MEIGRNKIICRLWKKKDLWGHNGQRNLFFFSLLSVAKKREECKVRMREIIKLFSDLTSRPT
jgi:hypothetical protein